MNTGIEHQLAAWCAADQAAHRAQRRFAPALDLYCQGMGRPPSARAIATVLARRRQAARALRAVLEATAQARCRLPLL